MMSPPRFALERKAVVIAMVVVTFLFGIYQFATMPRRADPLFTIRGCQVVTQWPGIDAERVERLVTAPLERTVADLAEVTEIRSTTTTGLSVIQVTASDLLPPGEIPQVWDRVRAKIEIAQTNLPTGTSRPVVNDDFGQTAILQLAVFARAGLAPDAGRPYDAPSLRDVAETIRDRLILEDGVARVQLHGEQNEQIVIEATPEQWAVSAVTIQELEQALDARSVQAGGGTVETPDARLAVQVTGEFRLEDEVRNAVIRSSEAGTALTVDDLGLNVYRSVTDPPSEIVRFGDAETGTDAIILSVVMEDGAKVTEVGPRLFATVDAMERLEKVIPPDIGVEVVFDESGFVDRKITDFIINVVQAVLIVVAIALLLAGFRAALVMAAAVPFVMIIAIGLSTFLGVQLEQMSIASLIIALGMLVDNAVVVTDNTRRYLNEGLAGRDAAIRGVEEILFPTLVGTFTTVFAFLPLAIVLTGSGREYVFSIPAVVSITMLVSWVLAVTLTTLMAYAIIRRTPPGAASSPLAWVGRRIQSICPRALAPLFDVGDRYAGVLNLALRQRVLVVLGGLSMLVGVTFLPIGSEFFPEDIREYSFVDVWLPEGASLDATNRAALDVEQMIRRVSAEVDADVRRMYTSVGGSGPRFVLGVNPTPASPNFAQIIVETSQPLQTNALVAAVRNAARDTLPGVRVIHNKLSLGPGVSAPIGIRLSSPGLLDPGFADIAELRTTGRRIADVFQDTAGLWDVHDTWGVIAREVSVDIDTTRAATAGATNTAIAKTLNAYLNGHRLTTLRDGDQLLPIVFRMPAAERGAVIDPRRVFVESARGKIPLDSVADVGLQPTVTRIERKDQQRMIEIRARVDDGLLANERLAAMRPQLDAIEASLPPGMSLEYGGTAEETGDAQVEMLTALGMGLVLIILCLIVQYNGILKPTLVLATVPMGLIGALLGVYLSGNPLGFMPLLGLVALTGIVVNSGILYLEFAENLIDEGRSDQASVPTPGERSYEGLTRDAFISCLVEAGRRRLLPIILTASTTIGGLIPLALFGGPMWEGMAYLLIGGLAAATVLTLVMLPVLYSLAVSTRAIWRRAPADPGVHHNAPS